MKDPIKEKIIELLDNEPLKLKFGCKLLRNDVDPHVEYNVLTDRGWGNNNKKVWVASVPFGSISVEADEIGIDDKDWKILGRDLTLEDILRAIRTAWEAKLHTLRLKEKNDRGFFVNQYGIFYEFIGTFKNGEKVTTKYLELGWILGKPYDQQPKETKAFLGQVLGVK